MENLTQSIGLIIASMFIILFAAVLMAWPTQWLWNGCLVPAVDGIHEIGFWQALGLNFLFSMLFKSTITSTKN
jgi:hypothetical protein